MNNILYDYLDEINISHIIEDYKNDLELNDKVNKLNKDLIMNYEYISDNSSSNSRIIKEGIIVERRYYNVNFNNFSLACSKKEYHIVEGDIPYHLYLNDYFK